MLSEKKKDIYTLSFRPSIVRNQTNQTTTKFWDNDAQTSFLSILLEWIADERNADKYFGAQDTSSKSGFSIDNGITKAGLCKQISEVIKTYIGHRTALDQKLMISLENSNRHMIGFLLQAISDAKKIKTSIDSMMQCGRNEMMDSSLEKKKEHYQLKISNKTKRLEVESKQLRIEKEEKEK